MITEESAILVMSTSLLGKFYILPLKEAHFMPARYKLYLVAQFVGVSEGNRLSFQGRWYVCPGLLSRLAGRSFEVYYDRRDVGVLYIFVEGIYVGEAYCPQLMGGRKSRVGS